MKGLYIHLPFCKNKCSYCGFYSEPDSYHLQGEYFKALIKDLRSRKDKNYNTLYIGGGTPSCVNRGIMESFLTELFEITGTNFRESTIEANPESTDSEFLELVDRFGFSRLSIGCQSTSDAVLKKLTRIHSGGDIFRAVAAAKKLCPHADLNLDVMYDIPDVEQATVFQTLDDIISMEPGHISAYSYSYDTDFLKDRPKEDTDFTAVRDILENAGYKKYEISNFARDGHESIHNIKYWELTDYDGLGASAWSLENDGDKRILRGKTSDIIEYTAKPDGYSETEISEYPQTVIEKLIFGLRMTEGVNVKALLKGADNALCNKLYKMFDELKEKELLLWDGSAVSLSRKGELFLDSVQELFWQQLP